LHSAVESCLEGNKQIVVYVVHVCHVREPAEAIKSKYGYTGLVHRSLALLHRASSNEALHLLKDGIGTLPSVVEPSPFGPSAEVR